MSKQNKILHLNLHRKWFDLISQGIKLEEYREIKKSVIRLLFDVKSLKYTEDKLIQILRYSKLMSNDEYTSNVLDLSFDYDYIIFSNGYKSDRDQIKVEFKGLEIGEGQPDWGAVKDEIYFKIKLGKVQKL